MKRTLFQLLYIWLYRLCFGQQRVAASRPEKYLLVKASIKFN